MEEPPFSDSNQHDGSTLDQNASEGTNTPALEETCTSASEEANEPASDEAFTISKRKSARIGAEDPMSLLVGDDFENEQNPCCASSTSLDESFFQFPADCNTRKSWIARVRREGFTPSSSSYVCSKHFSSDQFTEPKSDAPEKFRRKRLKKADERVSKRKTLASMKAAMPITSPTASTTVPEADSQSTLPLPDGMITALPSIEKNKCSLPDSFGDFSNCRIIIDCTEFRISVPRKDLAAAASSFSNYKHYLTGKFLIGVAANGAVTFVSNGFPGSASGKAVTKDSGILHHLQAGDLILADKGHLAKKCVFESACLSCWQISIYQGRGNIFKKTGWLQNTC
eukprot:gene7382-13129_t